MCVHSFILLVATQNPWPCWLQIDCPDIVAALQHTSHHTREMPLYPHLWTTPSRCFEHSQFGQRLPPNPEQICFYSLFQQRAVTSEYYPAFVTSNCRLRYTQSHSLMNWTIERAEKQLQGPVNKLNPHLAPTPPEDTCILVNTLMNPHEHCVKSIDSMIKLYSFTFMKLHRSSPLVLWSPRVSHHFWALLYSWYAYISHQKLWLLSGWRVVCKARRQHNGDVWGLKCDPGKANRIAAKQTSRLQDY